MSSNFRKKRKINKNPKYQKCTHMTPEANSISSQANSLELCVCVHFWYFFRVLIRVAPNLTFSNLTGAEFDRISELKFSWSRSLSQIWLKLVFWSQNNTPVIKLMASTMLSAAIEAVHFSASFVALLFASY